MSNSFVTPGIVACQTPLSMVFSRQEHWSGSPFPPPGDLPDPEIEPMPPTSPALASRFFNMSPKSLVLGLVLFSCSVMSDSLQHNRLQHARLPCPSPTPRTWSNSCPSSQGCHPTHLILCPLLLLPSIFSSIRVFSKSELVLTELQHQSFQWIFRTDFL